MMGWKGWREMGGEKAILSKRLYFYIEINMKPVA